MWTSVGFMRETSSAAAPAPTAHCLRCGRTLRSARSIALGYGPTCAAKIRTAAKTSSEKATQVAKAVELIEVGGLVPVKGSHVFRVVASNGVDHYLTAPEACTCAAGLRGRFACYHRLAAQLVAARPAEVHEPIAA